MKYYYWIGVAVALAACATTQALDISAALELPADQVSSIQRVNTAGSVAPATGRGPDARGTQSRVAYTAEYRLFAAK